MRRALTQAGLEVQVEVAVPVSFRGEVIGVFRADLIVEKLVLIELKATSALVEQHVSQTLNYLRATPLEVALLMNFGPKAQFKRLLMSNARKKSIHP